MPRPPVSRAHDEPPAGAVRLSEFPRVSSDVTDAAIRWLSGHPFLVFGRMIKLGPLRSREGNHLVFSIEGNDFEDFNTSVDLAEIYMIKKSQRRPVDKDLGTMPWQIAFGTLQELDRLILSGRIRVWGRIGSCMNPGVILPADLWPPSSMDACERGMLHFGERWLALPDGSKIFSLHLVKAQPSPIDASPKPAKSHKLSEARRWLEAQLRQHQTMGTPLPTLKELRAHCGSIGVGPDQARQHVWIPFCEAHPKLKPLLQARGRRPSKAKLNV